LVQEVFKGYKDPRRDVVGGTKGPCNARVKHVTPIHTTTPLQTGK